MQAKTDPTPPSLTEILYALIPALILWFESILADPARLQPSAVARVDRMLRYMRAMARLLGIPKTVALARRALRAVRPRRPSPAYTAFAAPLLPLRRPHPCGCTPATTSSIAPSPARTLEL